MGNQQTPSWGAIMSKLMAGALAMIVLAGLTMAGEKSHLMKFGKDDVGKGPSGWKVDKGGKGEGSDWKVVADESAPSKTGFARPQTAAGPGALFNLCVADEPTLKDVEIAVAFK